MACAKALRNFPHCHDTMTVHARTGRITTYAGSFINWLHVYGSWHRQEETPQHFSF